MKKVALALLVVLAISSVSFAGWMPFITEVDNGNPNYVTFIVGLSVDDVNGITSVSDISVTGGYVVQYEKFDMDNEVFLTTPGPFSSTASAYLFDTHLLDLSQYGTGVTAAGDGWAETNDETLSELTTSSYQKYGFGDLVLANGPSTLAINNPVAGLNRIDFLQICLPVGGYALVTGLYTNETDANNQVPMVPFSFPPGALTPPWYQPEPGTVVLLICGGLCLAGIRPRRK